MNAKSLAVATLTTHGVERASTFKSAAAATCESGWRLGTLFGRLSELSGGPASAILTLTFRLVLEAQKLAEPVAWVTERTSTFFPPDASENGIDLNALAVVLVPRKEFAPSAADQLVRSAGFGLVVLDLGKEFRMPMPIQSRLAGLAKKHHTALLCLTEKSSDLPSLGPLVSLHVEAMKSTKAGNRYYCCEAQVLKDKRGRRWQHQEVCRGPDGLC